MRQIAVLLVTVAGLLRTVSIDGGERAGFGPRTFLLALGGQDYVGVNSYDNDGKGLPGETKPHSV